MKKIILLFVMVLAVGIANAAKDRLYASFQQSGGGASRNFTYEGNKFTWTQTNNNWMEMFSLTEGDLSNYESLNITITADASNNFNFRLFVNGTDYSNVEVAHGLTSENLTVCIPLSSLKKKSDASLIDISKISSIRIAGAGSGSNNEYVLIYPADVYLEKAEDVERMDIRTRVNSAHASSTDPFKWTLDGKTVYANLNQDGAGVLYGYDSDNSESNSFSVVGYDKAIHRVSAGTGNAKVRYLSSSNVETEFFKSTSDISGINYVSTIKCSGALTVQAIDFIKEYKVSSTTAFGIAASERSTVNYDRTFTTDKKATVCLPFDLTDAQVSETGGKFYKFIGATASTLQFQEVSSTTAYTPYIFVAGSETTPFASLTDTPVKASAGATTTVEHNGFTFTGTLAKTDVASGSYGIYGDAFVQAGTGVTIKAFRAYFTGGFIGAHEMSIDLGGDVTGIKTMNHEPSTVNQMYNLQGQRVSEGHKGLVIMNGKKVVMK
ncbi:MAG: hypothetical protein J6M40_03060 [Prevotella sp.]|nr:hypothetical protein [Prevotella sp.]